MLILTITIVTAALLIGAALGLSGWMNDAVEGFLIAAAGGALVVAVCFELIQPATEMGAPLALVMGAILAGGIVFTGVNYVIDSKVEGDKGGGLLAAVTLDGIPENLALGVALMSADLASVAALAGSIFLSNLPEAAGGAKRMVAGGIGKAKAFAIWTGAALLLILAALAGNFLVSPMQHGLLASVQAFAAGTVIAALAVEVFPKAYEKGRHMTGIAVTAGLMFAFCLHHIGA
ncbi:MAG: zinc transporter [Litorimonas sp.]